MNKRDKWLKALCDFASGRKATCPECGGHKFKDAYVRVRDNYGWGALWCEECRAAFVLSRVILTEETEDKTVPSLPTNLKFY